MAMSHATGTIYIHQPGVPLFCCRYCELMSSHYSWLSSLYIRNVDMQSTPRYLHANLLLCIDQLPCPFICHSLTASFTPWLTSVHEVLLFKCFKPQCCCLFTFIIRTVLISYKHHREQTPYLF